jgi:GTP diphosphokinase / guanosine-3',5'-bis(diphosphate) 3'-diphosphatase
MDRRLLEAALHLIKQYHVGVESKSGEPFYLYSITVAHILLEYTQDPDTLLAALLHATIDTTCLSWPHIALRFNTTVYRKRITTTFFSSDEPTVVIQCGAIVFGT